MKMYVRTRSPVLSVPPPPVPPALLEQWKAVIVVERETYLMLQVPAINAVPLQSALAEFVDVAEIRDEYDILHFSSFPIDARLPQPSYPSEWQRLDPLPTPARDAFVLQFASVIESTWIEELAAVSTVLDYLPFHGYLVLGEKAALEEVVGRLPIQLFRLHQPVHRVSARLRGLKESSLVHADVQLSIATVPEGAEAVAVLAEGTILQIRPSSPAGDRILFTVMLDLGVLPRLAALPAVLGIDTYTPPVPIVPAPQPRPLSFYTLTPCRLLDTREDSGTPGSLSAGAPRAFPVRGRCGVPATAVAVSVNTTAVAPAGDGSLAIYAANLPAPPSPSVGYRSGRSRAGNAIVTLDPAGYVALLARGAGSHVVLDVNGYFQ